MLLNPGKRWAVCDSCFKALGAVDGVEVEGLDTPPHTLLLPLDRCSLVLGPLHGGGEGHVIVVQLDRHILQDTSGSGRADYHFGLLKHF